MSTKTITSRAKHASYEMMTIKEPVRNKALFEMADALEKHMDEILAANRADMDRAREREKNSQFLDRLELTQQRISQMARGVRDLAALPDPIAEMEDVRTLPNGLLIGKQRVPLGCIAIIYEARPNVTADSISLCVKSANAVILRGGSDAIDSNRVIADIMRSAAVQCGIPADAIGFVDDVSRQSATELMHSVGDVDVLIPRGGKELIQAVVRELPYRSFRQARASVMFMLMTERIRKWHAVSSSMQNAQDLPSAMLRKRFLSTGISRNGSFPDVLLRCGKTESSCAGVKGPDRSYPICCLRMKRIGRRNTAD